MSGVYVVRLIRRGVQYKGERDRVALERTFADYLSAENYARRLGARDEGRIIDRPNRAWWRCPERSEFARIEITKGSDNAR